MKYRYSKNQIFSKKLNVPKDILEAVYTNTLSFQDFIKYDLQDKIPESCLLDIDQRIIAKTGLDKAKNLDWDLLRISDEYKNIILDDEIVEENVNATLYEKTINKFAPTEYTSMMREAYPDKLFENQDTEVEIKFNHGTLTLKDMVLNWEEVSSKDLTYCLLKDAKNTDGITDEELKTFVKYYIRLIPLIIKYNDIYDFINEYRKCEDFYEELKYVKSFTDKLVEKIVDPFIKSSSVFTKDELKEIFKYSSLEQYLKTKTRALLSSTKITSELRDLPVNYIFNNPIPFDELATSSVLSFIGEYGLKNIVDFDLECGHFFTANECEMLKLMYDMYLRYASNETDPKKYIRTRKNVNVPYTKDEFYEAMRRMIIYGPTDQNYAKKAPDYRTMEGEFRVRNKELFVDDEAPEEFKKLFYTKSITPMTLKKQPELIKFLEGKDLSSCLKAINVEVGNKTVKFYRFLEEKLNFDELIEFIIEYAEVLNVIFDDEYANKYNLSFESSDTMEKIKNNIDDVYKKILIKEKVKYPDETPEHLVKHYPNLFISDDAPGELKKLFKERHITNKIILENPEFLDYIKNLDLEVVYPYMSCSYKKTSGKESVNFIAIIKKLLGQVDAFAILKLYGNYIEKIFDENLSNVEFNEFKDKDELLNELDERIYTLIIDGKIKYDDNLPEHFKTSYPTLFLDESVEDEIKERFYNRDFVIEDFEKFPELFGIFNTTEITCGLNIDYSWAIPLLSKTNNSESNYNKIEILKEFNKIEDYYLKDEFIRYFEEIAESITSEKIAKVSKIMNRLIHSDSNEIVTFRRALAYKLLRSDNAFELLEKIENNFTNSNLPTAVKIMNCSKLLCETLNGDLNRTTLSADYLKSILGSNNRPFIKFLDNLSKYQKIYEDVKAKRLNLEYMDEAARDEVYDFKNLLESLYNSNLKDGNSAFTSSEDVEEDIISLAFKISPDHGLDYDIGNRIVSLYCHRVGIETTESAKLYMSKKVEKIDSKNRTKASFKFDLKKGDLVKGLRDATYLKNILQNGILAKEYLGEIVNDEPYQVEFSMVENDEGSILNCIGRLDAKKYGPIWAIIKNEGEYSSEDDKFIMRTGISSSEISYFCMKEYDPRVGLEIAMNGFYIPVVDGDGNLVFTTNDYDELREEMSGLKYYNEKEYKFSNNLTNKDTKELVPKIEQNKIETQVRREKINALIKRALYDLDIKVKYRFTGKLTKGYAELVDIGSTSRVTNKPGDTKYDMILRLDREIYNNPYKMRELKQSILKYLDKTTEEELTINGDLNLTDVFVDEKTLVDINIKFRQKTNAIEYYTNNSLIERLTTIEQSSIDKLKYKYVIANILLAKQVLQEAEVYKPSRISRHQGGIGGVGIECWILQHGGSFETAAQSFLDAALGKTFAEFKKVYHIWDFGENSSLSKKYVHDDYINNMNETGYEKMILTLSAYVRSQKEERFNSN